MIYLDNSATTAIAPEVLDAMLPYLKEEYGNPSSKYYTLAENAKKAVEEARQQVASLIGCTPEEVIFTSGATESNNFTLKGIADHYSNKGNLIVTSKVEHPSVIETCKYLETKGFKVTYLDVDKFGRIDLNELESLLTASEKPLLVSLIWGNNEIGSLNNIEKASELCSENGVFFHTDATQVMGKVDVNLENLKGVNFLSCSAHKVHGPKGIGACIVRKNRLGIKTKLTPLLHGGGQENDYRSGTLAVHNIVGFGKAAELAAENLAENVETLEEYEKAAKEVLVEKFADTLSFNNDEEDKIPGLLSLQLAGMNNELFIRKVADRLAISTGSACSSTKPSHVLAAIGKDKNEVRSTLRITLSPQVDIEQFKETIRNI